MTTAMLHLLRIGLRDPFRVAGGVVTHREIGLVEIQDGSLRGWGEAAPFPGQDEPFREMVASATGSTPSRTLRAAIDEAVSDFTARKSGSNLGAEVGAATVAIPLSIAVGMGPHAADRVDALVGHGVTRFKVKVAPGTVEHVRTIRERHPEVVLGVDANGSFSQSDVSALCDLADCDLAYVEQPTAALQPSELDALQRIGAPVFADESVTDRLAAERLLATDGIGGVVVKPGRHGWVGAVDLVAMARDAGKHWRASGLLETNVGRAFTNLLAGAPDAFVSDVAPAGWFLTEPVVPADAVAGHIRASGRPGAGTDVDVKRVRNLSYDTIHLDVRIGQDIESGDPE